MRKGAILALAALVGACILSGCIADTAEDTELPWSSNQRWEGIAPLSPTIIDRYD